MKQVPQEAVPPILRRRAHYEVEVKGARRLYTYTYMYMYMYMCAQIYMYVYMCIYQAPNSP